MSSTSRQTRSSRSASRSANEDRVNGKTLGLFFGRDNAFPERKCFASVNSRENNNRFIEVQRAFKFDYNANFYQAKVIVGKHKYYVAGTYNQRSVETNTSLEAYGYNKEFAGDVAIFFHSKYEPERFLEALPRYTNANEREIAIRRVITAPHATTLPNFYVPRWIDSSIPFLGFAPSSNPFKFHFLKCLDYALDSLPIVKDNDGHYVLRSSEQANWDSLERNMRAFLRACMRVNSLAVPEDFRLWPYPNNYGYRLRWKMEMDARYAAMRSRQAFIL
ncbi:uncharacterized protein C8R40DRAFT_1175990 [Lentinula edodes]|uniref:uncharacterized protein n=1 Tax=Lentinula edodes TaxID=5353 RepID=UPI001E8D3943|nr:uncharacterized protein C8R40DRAFT_1175990 [Lentinula edodes]KAH7870079.1 hypothetical protein C8R40DRAFT_1175990 [Lentinula edodes]